jgi:hypothetical protein
MSNLSLPSDTDNEGKLPGWRHWWDRAATPSNPSSPLTKGKDEGDAVGLDGQDDEEDLDARWTWLEVANDAATTRKEARARARA